MGFLGSREDDEWLERRDAYRRSFEYMHRRGQENLRKQQAKERREKFIQLAARIRSRVLRALGVEVKGG